MPKPMTPDEVLRELRRLRFSSKTGRPITFRWLARQTGYDFGSLYRAINRGFVAKPMASRLAVALQEGQNAFLGRIGGGLDPRGGWTGGRQAKRKPGKAPAPSAGPARGPRSGSDR